MLTGVLLFLVQPRFSLTLLAPFVLTPLLIALSREWRPKYRALLGALVGVVHYAGMCHWIQFVIQFHGGVPWAASWLVFALFCIGCSVNTAAFAMLAGTVIHKPYAMPAIAFLWVGLERIPFAYGFMWLKLGNAAADMGLPLRLARFTGVYGISFVFALLAAGLVTVLLKRPRKQLLWLLPLAILFILPAVPGGGPGSQKAVVVQPDFDEEKRWTTPEVPVMEQRLESLSLREAQAAPGEAVSLIIWPEAPAPLYWYMDSNLRDRVAELARLTHTQVLIGTVTHEISGDPLNSAVMVSPQGQLVGRYDKLFLVPFGEYVPPPFSTIAGKVSNEIGDFVPGKDLKVLGGNVGAFICYESAFPQLVREFAARGATVFANLSNDGYFGRSAAREQHLLLVRMRAVENQRWILRGTNNGVTASIDPAGQVRQVLPPFVETTGRLGFERITETTFYTRSGDWFAWCALLLGIGLSVYSQVPAYNPPPKPSTR